jgi:ubiquinone/menaquinone biosynthesis C-methylase UbiE
MKINFLETTNNLQTRIDIHNIFGKKDIDEWMLNLLNLPKSYMKILDIGCGAGKQCFTFYNYLNCYADITGGDVSAELINSAIQENAKIGNPITFIELNFNERFPFKDNQFDLVSCSFAIYYSENIPFTLSEMQRILKPGGRLFISGPNPQKNKRLYYDIIHEATGKQIKEFGNKPYDLEIKSYINSNFSKVEVHLFENPLVFETLEPFMVYTRASLSEERKQSSNFFHGLENFEHIMQQISEVARQHLQQEGRLVMTKVVDSFIATK